MKKLIGLLVFISGLMAQQYYCASVEIVDAVTFKILKKLTKPEMKVAVIGKDNSVIYDVEEVYHKYSEKDGIEYYKSKKGNIIVAEELPSGNLAIMYKPKQGNIFIKYFCMSKEKVEKKRGE